jgi:alpha-beta hydrolase superfamily lysophospholipase
VIPRRLVTRDGVTIALLRVRARRDGRPTVLLTHGAFTNHRVWLGQGDGGGLAHFLTARGFDVWLADLRHHGSSDREPVQGAWCFEDWIRHDATALIERIDEETGGAPLIWVGHSSGGVVGLCWLARHSAPRPLATIITLGTPGPQDLGWLRRRATHTLIALTRLGGRGPGRLLRLGSEDEAPQMLIDWLGWNVRGAWVGRDGFDYLAALARTETPFLSIAGGADRLFAPPGACEQLVRASGARRKELIAYPGLSHRGLLLDARARERCWPGVAQWIEDTVHYR